MRRLLVLVTVLTLVAAACGDGDGALTIPTTVAATSAPTTTTPGTTSTPETTAVPDTTGPSALEGGYPQAVVDVYMEGCTENGDAEFCRCTIAEFQVLLSLDEFVALGQGDPLSDVVLDVTEFCLAEAGRPEEPVAAGDGEPVALDLEQLLLLTQDDLVSFWGGTLPDLYGVAYEDLAAVIPYFPSQGDLPPCGPDPLPIEAYQENAFYCRPGDFIAWDAEVLIPGLYTEFGDFAVALVLAHEWAHAVQARASVDGPTIMTELQADCFAGVWAGAVDAGQSELLILEPGDLEEAMAGYLLFRDPPGTDPGDPQAHGSAFDRVNAFQDGFLNGPEKCRAYEQGEFLVVDIPLTEEDLQTGGDLPFADVAPLVIEALELYWSLLYPQLFGTDYVPMTNFGPYLPSTGLLPPCGPGEPNPDAYLGNAFYCPPGDFVAWDNENLPGALPADRRLCHRHDPRPRMGNRHPGPSRTPHRRPHRRIAGRLPDRGVDGRHGSPRQPVGAGSLRRGPRRRGGGFLGVRRRPRHRGAERRHSIPTVQRLPGRVLQWGRPVPHLLRVTPDRRWAASR